MLKHWFFYWWMPCSSNGCLFFFFLSQQSSLGLSSSQLVLLFSFFTRCSLPSSRGWESCHGSTVNSEKRQQGFVRCFFNTVQSFLGPVNDPVNYFHDQKKPHGCDRTWQCKKKKMVHSNDLSVLYELEQVCAVCIYVLFIYQSLST